MLNKNFVLVLFIVVLSFTWTVFASEYYSEGYIDEIDIAADFFSEEAELNVEEYDESTYFIAKNNGEVIGLAGFSRGRGYGGIMELLIIVDRRGEILGYEVIIHSETEGIGTPVTEENFINRFVGLNITDPLEIGEDIDVLSGATGSSQGVAEAFRNFSDFVLTLDEAGVVELDIEK